MDEDELDPENRDARFVRKVIARALSSEKPEPPPAVRKAADWLGVAAEDLDTFGCNVHELTRKLVGHRLLTDASAWGLELVSPEDPDRQPTFEPLATSMGSVDWPTSALVRLPAGRLAQQDIVVWLRAAPQDSTARLSLLGPPDSRRDMPRLLADLISRANSVENPLRGSYMRATLDRQRQLTLEPQDFPTTTRHDLRLPQELWDEIDVNVHRHLARIDDFRSVGLGTRRGIMLHGPPGTGKTHLCRVVAAEVAGKVTVIVPDAAAMTDHLVPLYAYARDLAPSIVVLEDIDIVARKRAGSTDPFLKNLLYALEEMPVGDKAIVTMATTNDLEAIDPAARRAARIDRILELPHPDRRGREMILEGYLERLGSEFDLRRIARATDGATGADLRELIRHALLATDGPVTTETLIEAARQAGMAKPTRHGSYL